MTTPTPTRSDAPMAELLIDRYLPHYDVGLVEHTLAEADLATTWQALYGLDLAQVHTPLMDAAMSVRVLPARVAARLGRGAQPEAPTRLPLGGGGPPMQGWLSLGEIAEREIALGAVGRFWRPDIQWYDVTAMTPDAFASFSESGWGRIAANFTVLPYTPSRTLLTYEVRTATADPDAARRFARYWTVIRPFVGHIMRAALATVRADAEPRAGR
ncbi:MAG: hypothetical protein K0S40_2484 [Actinomycetospora sp.]|jgi:hypothetical protein|nr:hypothetical protein [Actinomycetospora sp.]